MKKFLLVPATVGLALVLPAQAYAAALLPDLGMARVQRIVIDTTYQPGHKLLRYNALLPNIGKGAFEVRGTRSSTAQTNMSVKQVLYQSGGGTTTRATGATVSFQTGVWRLGALEAGWLQSSSGHIAALVKHWYCPQDDSAFNLSLPGAPSTAKYTSCGGDKPALLSVTLGMSVGWADNYGPYSYQQYIDITNVPDGTYYLYAQADPNNYFQESNETNNTTWTEIKIKGTTVTKIAYGPHV